MFTRPRFSLITAVAAIALVCSSVPAAASPGAQRGGVAGETLRIGFTTSESGSLNTESTYQTQGLRLWADDVNRRGGISAGGLTYHVQLVSYDDESRRDRVEELYNRLIAEDDVDFLISPYGSTNAAASVAVSEQYGKTNLVVGAASNSIFTRGNEHAFQVISPASAYLTGAIDMLAASDPAAQRVALVNENDLFSTDVATAARAYAEQKGFQVVVNESYDTGTTDFTPLIDRMASENPDAILGGGHFADGSILAQQLAASEVSADLVALLVAPAVPEFGELGEAARGVVAPSQWEPQVTYSEQASWQLGIPYAGPSVDEFTQRFQAAYGQVPSYHAAGGYAGGLILEQAIIDAGSTAPDRVEAALASMDLLTFYGRTQFSSGSDFGLQVGHEMVYLQWQQGPTGLERQIVWPEAAASADAVIGTAAPAEHQQVEVSVFYVLQAEGGTLQPREDSEGQYRLTLSSPHETVVGFTDRPNRFADHRNLDAFMANWEVAGFTANPPNAALVVRGEDQAEHIIVATLEHPELNEQRSALTFDATLLRDISTGAFSAYASTGLPDDEPPMAFTGVTAFVDANRSIAPPRPPGQSRPQAPDRTAPPAPSSSSPGQPEDSHPHRPTLDQPVG